jgi:hypothetical protein
MAQCVEFFVGFFRCVDGKVLGSPATGFVGVDFVEVFVSTLSQSAQIRTRPGSTFEAKFKRPDTLA